MTTRHLVDPELAPLLDQPTVELTRAGLPELRAARRELADRQRATQPAFPDVDVSERYLPGPKGAPDVRALVYVPKRSLGPVPALLWIHGGGYVMGSPEADDLHMKTIVRDVGCAAVSVDYRLAPEAPFPAALDDCYAALIWLCSHAAELGVRPDRLAIGGASAGGGLAAALGLLARDRGQVPLAFQMLLVPMLDDRTATAADPHPHTGEFMWTPEKNHFGWAALLGTPARANGRTSVRVACPRGIAGRLAAHLHQHRRARSVPRGGHGVRQAAHARWRANRAARLPWGVPRLCPGTRSSNHSGLYARFHPRARACPACDWTRVGRGVQ